MFGTTDAQPSPDAGGLTVGTVSGIGAANAETVGHWLDDLPERSWDIDAPAA